MNRFLLYRLFLIIFFLPPGQVYTQIKTLDPVVNPGHIKIHQIGPEEGMSSPYLLGAFQDQYGYIWIGGENGADVYDGYQFRNCRVKRADSSFSQLVWASQFTDDDDGGLWICSHAGLFYYDRTKDAIVNQFRLPDVQAGFPGSVHGIYQDSRGLYWIFSAHGILLYNREKDELIYTEIQPSRRLWWTNRDFNLLEEEDGSVWIPANPHGLYKYIPESGEFINFRHDPEDPGSISSDRVTDIIKDNNGDLWITTIGGGINVLKKTDPNTFEHIRHESGMKNTLINDDLHTLLMDRSGDIWIGGYDGFTKYLPDSKEFRSYRVVNKKSDFSNQDVSFHFVDINQDQRGNILLRPGSGNNGFFCFDPGSEQIYHLLDVHDANHGLRGSNWVMDFIVDQSGLTWLLTQGGLNLVEIHPQKTFHQFRSEKKLPGTLSNSGISSIYLDSQNTLWIGADGAVLNRSVSFDFNLPAEFRHFPINEILNQPEVISSILEKDQKDLWIGTWGGLIIFDRDKEKFSLFNPDPSGNDPSISFHVERLFKDSNGFLWIGTRHEGLYVYDPNSGKLVHYYNPDDMEGIPLVVNSFLEDKAGNMWIGHYGYGFSRLSAKEVARIFTPDKISFSRYSRGQYPGLSSNIIMQIHEDSRNRIWIGTTAGLNLFNLEDTSFHSFHEADGLPNDCIYGILEDERGNLWVSTMNGICKIVLKEGAGKDIIESTHQYGTFEGIKQPVFHEKSYFQSPDGWMYFGSINGLIVFHPDSIRENPIIPPVHITDILINDRAITDQETPLLANSIAETETIKLPFRQNFLSFEYVALNYLDAEKNLYKYMMEGMDDNWVEAGTRRFADYRDLSPGEYTFRVIACNEDGLWNEEGASIGIIIKPPWYRTILAYLLYGILLVALIYGFIRWRTWRLNLEKEKLEDQVNERTHTIEQQKEEILTANDVLAQQKEELQITLENLQETQTQLIQSEKLAALGGLVAGVAHELNTPVGISVTAASSLAEETREMADKYKSNKISRAEFKDYLNTSNQSARLILSNMEKAATMVQSFKQVSVDQSTEQKRKFKLKEYTEDVIRSLYPKLKDKSINIFIEMDDGLELNSFPGTYSQILTNLVLNSLVHGFDGKEEGTIRIIAREDHNKIAIEFLDDGVGIPKNIISKIFDPFFTTNQKAGTGLGLHIVHNLVDQKLKGSINCDSEVDRGTRYLIEIPVSS